MGECRPETIDFLDRAPLRVVAERDVPASPEQVFAVLADAPGWVEWFPAVTEARWTSVEQGGVGSTRFVRAGPLAVDERFIAWDPGVRWAFTFLRTDRPGIRAGVECVDLAATGAGATHVRYAMALELRPPLSWLARPFSKRARQGLVAGLDGLATQLS